MRLYHEFCIKEKGAALPHGPVVAVLGFVDMGGSPELGRTDLSDANLKGAVIWWVSLRGATLSGASLRAVDLHFAVPAGR